MNPYWLSIVLTMLIYCFIIYSFKYTVFERVKIWLYTSWKKFKRNETVKQNPLPKFQSFFIGENGRLSLSKTQFFCWVFAIIAQQVSGWIALYQNNNISEPTDYLTPCFTAPILTILALSFSSYVIVKNIASDKTNSKKINPNSFDLISTDGKLDLSKFQMLIWTILALIIFEVKTYSYSIGIKNAQRNEIHSFFPDTNQSLVNYFDEILNGKEASSDPAKGPDTSKLPSISWSFILLMGISTTGYISKKLITSPSTNNETSTTDIEETHLPNQISREEILNAIKLNGGAWMNKYGAIGISDGKKYKGGTRQSSLCIVFEVPQKKSGTSSTLIPPFLPFNNSSGKIINIPTDVIESGVNTISSSNYTLGLPMVYGTAKNPRKLGYGLSRIGRQDTGTIGLKVKKTDDESNRTYLLTCYHVLFPELIEQGIFETINQPILNPQVVCPSHLDSPGNNSTIATAIEGHISDFCDIALAELDENESLDSSIYKMTYAPNGIAIMSDVHANKKYVIRMTGRTSNNQEGEIEGLYGVGKIDYENNYSKTLNGLIRTTKISMPGDSGAAVVNNLGQVIGIVVSSNNNFTYVMPIDRIMAEFKIKLA